MNHTSLLSQEERNERKQLEIEQKDERNIALSDAAKARAWEWMVWLYALSICLLALVDVIQLAAFFILLGVFAVCQCYFIFRLWKYHKER